MSINFKIFEHTEYQSKYKRERERKKLSQKRTHQLEVPKSNQMDQKDFIIQSLKHTATTTTNEKGFRQKAKKKKKCINRMKMCFHSYTHTMDGWIRITIFSSQSDSTEHSSIHIYTTLA